MDEAVGIRLWRKLTASALALTVGLLLSCGAAQAEEPTEERVVLNADRVSYNDETGEASAPGPCQA